LKIVIHGRETDVIHIHTGVILGFDPNCDGEFRILLAIVTNSTVEKMMDYVEIDKDFNVRPIAGLAHNPSQQTDNFRLIDYHNGFQMCCDFQVFLHCAF
jgi:L-cysteine desulfidase